MPSAIHIHIHVPDAEVSGTVSGPEPQTLVLALSADPDDGGDAEYSDIPAHAASDEEALLHLNYYAWDRLGRPDLIRVVPDTETARPDRDQPPVYPPAPEDPDLAEPVTL